MKNEQLRRTLKVMRRTGDKAMVMDMDSEEVFVLMNLDNYEDLLDEVDTYEPKPYPENTDAEDDTEDYALDDLLDDAAAKEVEPEESLESDLKPVRPLSKEPEKKLDFGEDWDKKKQSTTPEEESLADVPNEEEEEKFYLEPLE